MKQIKTLQPNLAEQVRDAILGNIAEGKLRPGERIIQEQIADALSVSRQPVQQALLLLRHEGLLSDAPGRGLWVAPLDAEQVRHVYEIRAVVEGLAFRQAAMFNSEQARRLGPRLIASGREAVRSGSVAQLLAADTKLHTFVHELSTNPLIAGTLQAQWSYTQRVMGEVLGRDAAPRAIWDQHEQMIDAVMSGDADGAERLARDHILDSAAYVAAHLQRQRERAERVACHCDGPQPVQP